MTQQFLILIAATFSGVALPSVSMARGQEFDAMPAVTDATFNFRQAYRVGATTTLMNPFLDLGNNQVAGFLAYDSGKAIEGDTLCKAYGYTSGVIGQIDKMESYDMAVVLNPDGSVRQIRYAVDPASATPDQQISSVTCR